MDTSNACPTEDAICALLEYLVDPLLPAKFSAQDVPSQALQESVTKQVHAVVLLFNYYHRQQHPHLDYLGFEPFCKLATVLKPALLVHMKYMQKSKDTELDGIGEQLSLLEKRVMEACDICMSLHASKNVSTVEGWSILKVVIFLVDSSRKNCYMKFGSITQGVWSLIEKDIDLSTCNLEYIRDGKHINKRKRVGEKRTSNEPDADADAFFQKIGFTAVKEAAGISRSDVMIIEGHVVYSQSKEKTATRFYIMQCTSEQNVDLKKVPLEDVINSLQGPVLQKSSSHWIASPVVEYFHVLPYASVVSDWLSRMVSCNGFKKQATESESTDYEGSGRTIATLEPEVQMGGPSSDSDLHDHFKIRSHDDDICPDVAYNVKAENPNKRIYSRTVGVSKATENGCEVEFDSRLIPCTAERKDIEAEKRKAFDDEPCGVGNPNHAIITNQSNLNLNSLQATIASMETLLSEAALQALLTKRDKLILQHRSIEDEIAKCDKNIRTIIKGGKDDFAVKLESIIEGCNEASLRSKNSQRKKLSEAAIDVKNPCQELDAICYENNWILPIYHVSLSDVGFKANARLKEMDFECSANGDQRSNPYEARESAASKMFDKLQSVAKAQSVDG